MFPNRGYPGRNYGSAPAPVYEEISIRYRRYYGPQGQLLSSSRPVVGGTPHLLADSSSSLADHHAGARFDPRSRSTSMSQSGFNGGPAPPSSHRRHRHHTGLDQVTAPVRNPAPMDLCGICQQGNMRNEGMVQLQNCNHMFHKACLEAWTEGGSRNAGACPTCRAPLFANGGADSMGRMHSVLPERPSGSARYSSTGSFRGGGTGAGLGSRFVPPSVMGSRTLGGPSGSGRVPGSRYGGEFSGRRSGFGG